MGEAELARLLVDVEQLHLDGVALVNAGVLNGVEALPVELADMQQAFLARHEFHEAAVGHDAHHLGVVGLADLRDSHDGAYLGHSGVDAGLVGSRHLYLAHAILFVDGDGGSGLLLHTLDDLSTRANDSADILLGNLECLDARHLRLEVGARSVEHLQHLIQHMLASVLGLHKSLLEDLVGEAVAFDIHLCSGESVACTGGLEVHVAQVVLIAENVAKHGIFLLSRVLDEAHGDTGYGILDRHTGVHERQTACADCSHGAGTVALEDVAHHSHRVGEVLGYLALESAPCEVAVTYLATTYASLRLGLARGVGREVVVKQETLAALVEHFVYGLLVELCAEGTCGERLCLSAGEDGASVRSGQRAHLAPDGAYVGVAATVETALLIEHTAAHGVALHVVVVAVDHGVLLLELVGGKVGVGGGICLLEALAYLGECVLAGVLVAVALLGDSVSLVVAFLAYLLAELFVVHLMAVFSLDILAELLGELFLEAAHGFDGLVSGLEGADEVLLGHLVHLALYHHDVLLGSAYHDVHVGIFHLLVSRIDDVFTVYSGHSHLRDGALEGNVGACKRCGGCESGQSVGYVRTVGREKHDVHIHFCVIVGGEEGAERAVYKARRQNLIVGRPAFTFGKTAGETACGRIAFPVVALQRHKIRTRNSVLSCAYCGEQHRLAHTEHYSAVGLLGQFACFDANLPSVGKRNSLCDYVHLKNLFYYFLLAFLASKYALTKNRTNIQNNSITC